MLIKPSGSAFACWLVDQEIAVVTEGGEVAFACGGSHTQTLALAQSLIARLPGVTTTTITNGSAPSPAHWKAVESLRERYALPAIVYAADTLPDRLMV
ncbi:hypothetical protein [Sinosporangium siamense]|uniref:hypothetical protein n=1 Tax=Sinosporangium siamense TaxID=1367973 RepID=UPI00195289D0|nr:hypothetical protein [Sinosporangium siamense]